MNFPVVFKRLALCAAIAACTGLLPSCAEKSPEQIAGKVQSGQSLTQSEYAVSIDSLSAKMEELIAVANDPRLSKEDVVKTVMAEMAQPWTQILYDEINTAGDLNEVNAIKKKAMREKRDKLFNALRDKGIPLIDMETGNKEPETGNPQPETGNKESGMRKL